MKELINPWIIAGSLILATLFLAGLFWFTGLIMDPGFQEFNGEAALTIIPRPTKTPTTTPTEPAILPTSTQAILIEIGGYVKISGTEGSGLRLRDQPSLNGDIDYLGLEDEIYRVVDGPVDQDGYLWWFLEAPANDTRSGWAAANFLEVAQNP